MGRFTNICISLLGKDFYKLCIWKINSIRTYHNPTVTDMTKKAIIMALFLKSYWKNIRLIPY